MDNKAQGLMPGYISVKALPALQQTMNRLLDCFLGISTPILRSLYLYTFWEKWFGMVSKALLNSRYFTPTTFYPLGRSYPFTRMAQFIPDKATGSIFISLLCSTGLLINRSILLWAIGVSLTGGPFSQVSSSFFPCGSFPKGGSFSQVILTKYS